MVERGNSEGILGIPSPLFFGLLALLSILPFSMFVLNGVDMWVGPGIFFQCGVFVLWLLSFYEKERSSDLRINKPFLFLSFWIMLLTAIVFYESASKNFYNHLTALVFMNFLTFAMFYRILLEHMSMEKIKILFKFIAISISVIVFYCFLQKLSLDQFQNPLSTDIKKSDWFKSDYLVGTIGNPTHLSAYLAIGLPIFYMSEGIRSFIIACFIWLIIAWTDSVSGLITAIAVTLFYGRFFKFSRVTPVILGVSAYAVLFLMKGYDLGNAIVSYVNPGGRMQMWKSVVEIWERRPIFGYGLGYMNFLGMTDKTNTRWNHAHSEPLQFLLELGLVGFILIGVCVLDYFKTFNSVTKTSLNVCLASMFFGFLVNSLFNFPAHLWLISTLGMLSYSLMYVVRNEELHSYNA